MVEQNPTILHLSDLHFLPPGDSQAEDHEYALTTLREELLRLPLDWIPNIVCVSGDIGNRGDARAYEAARIWFNLLLSGLKLDYGKLVTCPGNHDFCRGRDHKVRCPKTWKKADELLAIGNWQRLSSPFDDYANFLQNAGVPPFTIGENGDYSYLFGMRTVGRVRFLSCNSSWFCQKNKIEGLLWLGQPLLRNLAKKKQLSERTFESSDIVVALLHHPPHFFQESENTVVDGRACTMDYLYNCSDIMLTGHLHAQKLGLSGHKNAHLINTGSAYGGAHYPNEARLLRLEEIGFRMRNIRMDSTSAPLRWNLGDPTFINYQRSATAILNIINSSLSPKEIRNLVDGQVGSLSAIQIQAFQKDNFDIRVRSASDGIRNALDQHEFKDANAKADQLERVLAQRPIDPVLESEAKMLIERARLHK